MEKERKMYCRLMFVIPHAYSLSLCDRGIALCCHGERKENISQCDFCDAAHMWSVPQWLGYLCTLSWRKEEKYIARWRLWYCAHIIVGSSVTGVSTLSCRKKGKYIKRACLFYCTHNSQCKKIYITGCWQVMKMIFCCCSPCAFCVCAYQLTDLRW